MKAFEKFQEERDLALQNRIAAFESNFDIITPMIIELEPIFIVTNENLKKQKKEETSGRTTVLEETRETYCSTEAFEYTEATHCPCDTNSNYTSQYKRQEAFVCPKCDRVFK
jgi:hypothetical protein